MPRLPNVFDALVAAATSEGNMPVGSDAARYNWTRNEGEVHPRCLTFKDKSDKDFCRKRFPHGVPGRIKEVKLWEIRILQLNLGRQRDA